MGYEIIYKTFTIKKDDVYIPFVVMGSNNCFETTYDGRQKRERNLHNAGFMFNNIRNFKSLDEMSKNFNFEMLQNDMNNGMIQGKYKTAEGLLKSFKKYIFTDDELKIQPRFTSIYYLKLNNDEKHEIKKIFNEKLLGIYKVLTDIETNKLIDECLNNMSLEIKTKLLNYIVKKEHLLYYHYSENTIKYAFKNKYDSIRAKPKSTYELHQELIDKPLIEFNNEDVEKIKGRKLLVYGYNKYLFDSGKIKPLHNGNYGFFKNRTRKYYTPLHNIHYYKVVN